MPAHALAKMHSRDLKRRKSKAFIRMDPDCAVCHAPAHAACDCEAKGLDTAIKQAEDQVMGAIYNEIRSWVRSHAQDHILEYFRQLADRRKAVHSKHIDAITANAWYHYDAPPHPQQVADAEIQLKRGIDEDWQASVERYPEVLQHFFGLVDLTLPPDDDPQVVESPLSPPEVHRKPTRRAGAGPGGGAPENGGGSRRGAPPAIMPPTYADRSHGIAPRTPPDVDRYDRHTPERRVTTHSQRDTRVRPREREREHGMRQSVPPQTAPYAPYAPY